MAAIAIDTQDTAIIADGPGAVNRLGPTGDPAAWGDWHPGEATVAFADLGLTDGGSRAQIVLYGRPFDEATYAVSAELTPAEARAIVARLTEWLAQASDEPFEDNEPFTIGNPRPGWPTF